MARRMGTVTQKPNGKWLARVAVGAKADGSIRRESKTFDSRADVEKWCVTHGVEMGGRPDLGAGVTLATMWDLYVNDKGKRLTKKTLSCYRSQMRTWLALYGDADISHITCADVQGEILGMTHENALHSKRALSSVLTYAVSIGALAENPLHGHDFEIPPKEVPEDAFDDDPFAVIDESRAVWDVSTVMRCFELVRGLPLESAWLACVGAGLRVEEALALRRVDVRRIEVSGVMVTQLAVHHASTAMERRKATKTRQSVRVVAMMEPFGERYWELTQVVDDAKSPVCPLSPSRQNKAWRNYFDAPTISKHAKKVGNWRGRLQELPYLPLSKMRNTHATLMQQAGVMDSINAAMHGHSERVSYAHYQRADTTEATIAASSKLRLVM